MFILKMRLERAQSFLTIEMVEGRSPRRGTWRRLVDESNSALQSDSGFWENWISGIPGGVTAVRLYDSTERIIALLSGYLCGHSEGAGRIVAPEFATPFGPQEFRWIVMARPERADVLATG